MCGLSCTRTCSTPVFTCSNYQNSIFYKTLDKSDDYAKTHLKISRIQGVTCSKPIFTCSKSILAQNTGMFFGDSQKTWCQRFRSTDCSIQREPGDHHLLALAFLSGWIRPLSPGFRGGSEQLQNLCKSLPACNIYLPRSCF